MVAPRVGAAGVSRQTFAVFMQPRWDEAMEIPAGADPSCAGVGQWRPGLTFGQFSERTVAGYYANSAGGGQGAANSSAAAGVQVAA